VVAVAGGIVGALCAVSHFSILVFSKKSVLEKPNREHFRPKFFDFLAFSGPKRISRRLFSDQNDFP
jgi:hypothetical protein